MTSLAPQAKFRAFDTNGNPLSGGKLYTYAAGTNTPLATYKDAAGTPNTNPVILDQYGQADIRIGASSYKFLVTDSADVTQPGWPVDDISSLEGLIVSSTAGVIKTVATFADLSITTAAIGQQVSLKGYTSQGDGGGGLFDVVSPSGLTADGGNVVINGGIAFKRKFDFLNALYFGATALGIVSDSSALQRAIDSLPVTGGIIFCPKGTYLFSHTVKTRNGVVILGEGSATRFLSNTDIEFFNSDNTTVNSAIFEAEFRDLYIEKTVTGATSKYDIHLYSPNLCKFERIHIKSGHIDSAYSATNVGGIFLDKPDTGTSSAFCNRIIDCWIQNNSVYFRNITDSVINGGYVWGHVRQFAIRFYGGGANAIENVIGIICSQYNGGIWLDGPQQNQIRIIGNEFDGNPLLDTGHGVYCPQGSLACLVAGNTFWGCDRHSIWLKDATSWTITGNTFYKGNAGDNSYDDIRLESVTIPVSGITITGNSHIIDDVRANKGYVVNEINSGGGSPNNNTYAGNTITGTGYLSNPYNILGNSNVNGISGSYTVPNRVSSGQMLLGNSSAGFDNFGGAVLTVNSLVSAAGTMDLAVNTKLFTGNPGGFSGFLYVTSTRYNFPTQSRREIFSVVCRGTTATITSISSQDGSAGASAFTITVPTNGTLRFTDTSASGSQIAANMTFVGAKSLA